MPRHYLAADREASRVKGSFESGRAVRAEVDRTLGDLSDGGARRRMGMGHVHLDLSFVRTPATMPPVLLLSVSVID